MKKIIVAFLAISAAITSCKKETSVPVPDAIQYMSYTANSTWDYEVVDNVTATTVNYTITSTNRDSTINGKTYHVFTNSSGSANKYYNITGNDYYNFQSLPASLGGNAVENIYLKDNVAVNNTWNQSYTISASGIPLTVNIVNTIAEKGISKTVNSIVYNDVIHVTSSLSVSAFGTPLPAGAIITDIQSYYAKKYGMIQSKYKISINYSGIVDNTDQQTNLKLADIK
jgi:hypothetical protein